MILIGSEAKTAKTKIKFKGQAVLLERQTECKAHSWCIKWLRCFIETHAELFSHFCFSFYEYVTNKLSPLRAEGDNCASSASRQNNSGNKFWKSLLMGHKQKKHTKIKWGRRYMELLSKNIQRFSRFQLFLPLRTVMSFYTFIFFLSFSFQLSASDGVQQSAPVPVTITVLDANDNTPTFSNVSYSVNLFTDMMPGETVLQVHTIRYTIRQPNC